MQMSKFIDKLKHLSGGAPEPMGFRPRQPAPPKPKMQLAASVAPESVGSLAGLVGVADALILALPADGALDKVPQRALDIPWGGWLKEAGVGVPDLAGKGCDFIVFPVHAPVEVIQGSQLGKILAVDASLGDGLLRVVNDLPVDAVFMTATAGDDSLTWERLLLLQRFGNLLTKPLLAPISANVTSSELQALWEAGIDCVVIEAAATEKLKNVRQTIDSMSFPLPRRREKAGALIPRINHEPHHVAEEEEGE
ncbi:MAG: hypothetical protein HYX84_02050 [Chloroflexi bacterium]|nr:hypothetical protein [Chloroflexota bacterium]